MFLAFAKFYQCFIQSFSKIVMLLTLKLKTTRSADVSALILIGANINEVVGGSLEPNLLKFKKTTMTKSKNLARSKNLTNLSKIVSINIGATRFLTSKARVAFI